MVIALITSLLVGGFAAPTEPVEDLYIVSVFDDYHALVERALENRLDGRASGPYEVGYNYYVDWRGRDARGRPVVYRLVSPTVERAIENTEFARGYAAFLYAKRGGL